MTDSRRNSPRRYFVDKLGRRVLIGLTVEETFEFEKLDHVPAQHDGGAPGRDAPGYLATRMAERWLELYGKHDRAWVKWMADSRAHCGGNLPFLN